MPPEVSSATTPPAARPVTASARRAPTSGPSSPQIRKKFDRTGLVEAIVNPNAAIAFGYSAELVVTRRHEPHIGFLLADGPTVALRDGYGRVLSFDARTSTDRVPLKSSLMPDPLALALTRAGRVRYRSVSHGAGSQVSAGKNDAWSRCAMPTKTARHERRNRRELRDPASVQNQLKLGCCRGDDHETRAALP